MEFQKLIEERRTIRKYSPEGKITKDELLTIIRAAQEAPSWKNSQTGRYYCVTSEDMVEKISKECLPEMNQPKAENAALIITTFVQNRSGFRKTVHRIMNLEMAGAAMIWDFRMRTWFLKHGSLVMEL